MIITSDRNYAVACLAVKIKTILFNFALNLIERCYIINIRVIKYYNSEFKGDYYAVADCSE